MANAAHFSVMLMRMEIETIIICFKKTRAKTILIYKTYNIIFKNDNDIDVV